MTPFAPVPLLFLHPIDSELQAFLQEAHALLTSAPPLLVKAEADLDAHGCGKKALRLADAAWQAQRTELLPGMTIEPVSPASLKLAQGRPRTATYVVLVALLLRGFLGEPLRAAA